MAASDAAVRQRWMLLGAFVLGVLVAGGIVAIGIITDDPDGAGSTSTDSSPTFTNITQCTTITEPGRYALRRNVGGATGLSDSCIVIRSSNVTLDGFGHTVGGGGVTNSTGIRISHPQSVSNVTVRTVTLTEWNRGLLVRNASRVTIRRMNVSHNAEGIAFWNATRSSVRKSGFQRNIIAITVDDASSRITTGNNYFDENYGAAIMRNSSREQLQRSGAGQNETRAPGVRLTTRPAETTSVEHRGSRFRGRSRDIPS
ncbi:right-handed parallel beta-helix repeat-containing protein [Halomicrococcus sp. SG-WS-1]|uniref:right-handed parallel beta-helix repeat-containing protein n=1 Tax=Halomicrococcus sp. SG-WS-1 TaxID=3439057 RepID=UPI003F79DD1F